MVNMAENRLVRVEEGERIGNEESAESFGESAESLVEAGGTPDPAGGMGNGEL